MADECQAGRLTPFATLFRTWANRRRWAARRLDIGAPVDDANLPTGCQRTRRFTEQIDGILDMQNIEEHGISGLPIGHPTHPSATKSRTSATTFDR